MDETRVCGTCGGKLTIKQDEDRYHEICMTCFTFETYSLDGTLLNAGYVDTVENN